MIEAETATNYTNREFYSSGNEKNESDREVTNSVSIITISTSLNRSFKSSSNYENRKL